MGAISSINTNGNSTNWRIKRLNKSSDNTFSGVESLNLSSMVILMAIQSVA